MQQAFDTAGTNAQDDVIRINQGNYSVAGGSVAFAYSTATSNAITVEGGFQSLLGVACGARTNDASLTVLSGSGVRQVARFSPGPGTNGDIEIKNLSVHGGFSASQSGAGLSVGGVGGYTGNISIERIIFENNISETFGGGLNVGSYGGFVYVLGNLFLKNRGMGNFCAALTTVNAPSQATASALFGNNTFIDNRCGEGTPAICSAGGVRIGGSVRMQFFNNVFAPSAITGSNFTISATPVEVNFNNIYRVVGTPPQSFVGNVSAVDPLFVNVANHFRLSAAAQYRRLC